MTQISFYNREVDTSGRGVATDFYDKVVTPFVVHLASGHHGPTALPALARARRTLRVEPGSQLEGEINALTARVKAGNIPKKAPGS